MPQAGSLEPLVRSLEYLMLLKSAGFNPKSLENCRIILYFVRFHSVLNAEWTMNKYRIILHFYFVY